MKYIMRHINAFTGEVLRESDYGDFSQTMACIKHYEEVEKNSDKNQDTIVLIDSDMKLWDAEYINYFINESQIHKGVIIYMALFKVRKRVKQVNSNRTI